MVSQNGLVQTAPFVPALMILHGSVTSLITMMFILGLSVQTKEHVTVNQALVRASLVTTVLLVNAILVHKTVTIGERAFQRNFSLNRAIENTIFHGIP